MYSNFFSIFSTTKRSHASLHAAKAGHVISVHKHQSGDLHTKQERLIENKAARKPSGSNRLEHDDMNVIEARIT